MSLASRLQSPWRDRRGRVSRLKAGTLGLMFVPGLWIIWQLASGEAGELPYIFLIYHSGIWATWLLLLSLAVSPARQILGWSQLIIVRRMIGVAGLIYTAIHIIMYIGLDRFDFAFIANEMVTRTTLVVATVSTIGLLALGVTSFDASIKKMGTKAWNQLHNLAYPAIGFAVLHFDMSPGSIIGVPFVMTGVFFWLIGWRVLNRFGKGKDPLALVGLAVASTVLTLAFEISWLAYRPGLPAFRQRFPASETMGFVFDLAIGLDPTWQVLILGLVVSVLAALFSYGVGGRRRIAPR